MNSIGQIIQLQVADLGCIKFVNIGLDPNQNLVRIAGDNDAGKSTVINAIKYALEGASTIPQDAIRHGLHLQGKDTGKPIDRAYIRLETDKGYIIERVIRKNKKGEQVAELSVQRAGDMPVPAAQSFLDEVSAKFPDPSRVAALTSKDLWGAITEIFDLQISEYDTQINEWKKEATFARRRLKEIGLQEEPKAPDSDYQFSQEDLKKATNDLSTVEQALSQKGYELKSLQERLASKVNESNQIHQQISNLNDALKEVELKIANCDSDIEEITANVINLEKEKEALTPMVSQAEKYREYFTKDEDYRKWVTAKEGYEKELQTISEKVEQITAEKIAKITSANLPNELVLTEDTQVMKGDFNWDTLSDSERLKTAVQLCCRTLPENGLRCLYFQRGESIGEAKRKIIAQEAANHNVTVFMEVFTERKIPEDGVIHIREGEIETVLNSIAVPLAEEKPEETMLDLF